MPPTAATALLLEGTVTVPATSALYVRLRQKGPLTQFVEFLQSDLADPSTVIPPPNERFQNLVKIDSSLHFSDYPLPQAVPLPGRPIDPIHRGPAPQPPSPSAPAGPIEPIHPIPLPSAEFLGNDGTVLTANRTSGQVTTLSGKSKDGHNYALTLQPFSSPAAGVAPNFKPWCSVRISVTDNGDDPLQFGFAYCPLEQQFDIFVERLNVSAGIAVNLQQLALQQDGSVLGTAGLTRDLTYYKNPYGTQIVQMNPETTDPTMYLPISAAFWPYLQRIGFFAPALRTIASQTADQVPPPAKPPIHTLASLKWEDTVQAFVANSIALVGPALGPLAASFIPPNDSGATPWIDAARWLGWALMKGTANPNLTAAFSGQYGYLSSLVTPSHPPSGKIPIFKAPSQNLTPASQINDLVGK